jgi:benzoyl-CoA reductase/2-hydroxyglutaryl-CoA dehydratase subunit BcrC/BadD/HgdB
MSERAKYISDQLIKIVEQVAETKSKEADLQKIREAVDVILPLYDFLVNLIVADVMNNVYQLNAQWGKK